MKKSIFSYSCFSTPIPLIMACWFGWIFLFSTSDSAFGEPKPTLPLDFETLLERGERSFQRGDFENAILHWKNAGQAFAERGETAIQITALIKLADAYQALGQYPLSIDALNGANTLANSSDNQHLFIATINSLGAAYVAIGKYQKAAEFLQKGVEKARAIKATGLLAAALNNLGNLLTQEKKFNQAFEVYSESANLALSSDRQQLATKASVNAAMAAIEVGNKQKVEAMLLTAKTHLKNVADGHNKAFNWIALGQIAQRLSVNHIDRSRWRLFAYSAFKEATAIGERISDSRAASYAMGYLGGLYASAGQHDDALRLTRRAIFAIENTSAPEILFRWQWQTGRILKEKGENEIAIPAYQQAVSTLNSVRQDLSARHHNTSSFREKIGPLYLELVDLLLQSNDATTDEEKIQLNLVAARNIMEQLKAAELQDYFQDDCVTALQQKIRPLETIDRRTAAIYPILLADRTEILLSLPDGLKRFTIPTNRADMTKEVRHFRRKLENRTTREYLPHAQKLYQWLVAPLQPTLNKQQIDTLIMVPDESLRTVPMAALHDGEAFLIEKYAIANTPGLNLTDPKPLATGTVQLLANGLAEAVQGFPPLPHVASELASIQKIFGGQVLQDNEFLLTSIQNELKQKPYNIVHIASHGQFKSDSRETFVLTFDDKLTMDRLEQFIALSRFRDKPVELLTLSACQTAAGDDRAALGLAGIAIKAGARSAIATLWFINDRAASDLVTEFYRQLKETSSSKAQALKNAQVHLITNTVYQHPYFWSPFLLIGNWL